MPTVASGETKCKWHNASMSVPTNEAQRYLVYRAPYCVGSLLPSFAWFAHDLSKTGHPEFERAKNVEGWYVYDSGCGVYMLDNVVWWAEVPLPPEDDEGKYYA